MVVVQFHFMVKHPHSFYFISIVIKLILLGREREQCDVHSVDVNSMTDGNSQFLRIESTA